MSMHTIPTRETRKKQRSVLFNPARGWEFLVYSTSIVLISTVVWCASIFQTAVHEGIVGGGVPERAPLVQKTSLNEIQRIFENRSKEEKKYISGEYQFVDPSL